MDLYADQIEYDFDTLDYWERDSEIRKLQTVKMYVLKRIDELGQDQFEQLGEEL